MLTGTSNKAGEARHFMCLLRTVISHIDTSVSDIVSFMRLLSVPR